MKNKTHIGICITILFCNAFFLSSNPSQIEKISEIYYSRKLEDKQKLDSITNTFFNNTKPANQLLFADEILKIANKNKDYQWLYRGFYFKGNAYIFMADLDKAFNCYLKSLDALKQGNINEGLGDIYLGIGNSFSVSNSHEKAIFYYNKALDEYKSNSDTLYVAYSYLNLINEYHNLNTLDSVRQYIELTSSILDNKYNSTVKAYLLSYKALLYAKTNEIDSSLNAFSNAEKLFIEKGNIFEIETFQIELAKILLKNGNLNLAIKHSQACYKKAKEASLKQQISDAAKLLSDIYNELGNFEQAFKYQTEYLTYKDSINNEETIRKIADLRTEYEISQKQIEIDYLEKRRTINKIALISAISILVILFVLTFLLFRDNIIIKRQSKELDNLNSTKDKMFSIVSHDLRSPISSLIGISSVMKDLLLNKETDSLVKINDEMNKSLQNINNLLDNLLQWASNQQGYIPHNPENTYVYKIFIFLAEVFSNSANAKGVTLNLNIDKHTQVYVDKNTFETIFRNLIGNAIKFTNSGDQVTIKSEDLKSRVRFSVSDTGVGIAEDKLATLFNLSNNKSTWGTANEKGVGLGLRLAYEFTEINKGKISVKSEVGKGTTFYVEFPK